MDTLMLYLFKTTIKLFMPLPGMHSLLLMYSMCKNLLRLPYMLSNSCAFFLMLTIPWRRWSLEHASTLEAYPSTKSSCMLLPLTRSLLWAHRYPKMERLSSPVPVVPVFIFFFFSFLFFFLFLISFSFFFYNFFFLSLLYKHIFICTYDL